MNAIQLISSVGNNCTNAEASSQWYCETLGFQELDRANFSGAWLADLLGVPNVSIERRRLGLGEETLELWQFDPDITAENDNDLGSQVSCPAGNDAAFQHICIVTTDLHQAFAAGACHSRQISSEPQRLPDWNPGAGGIWAVKFEDPDGHPLELLQFPPGKGDRRWQQGPPSSENLGRGQAPRVGNLCLGLDHTAISVKDTQRSLRFYVETLGMNMAGQGHNHGPEQDRMDGMVGTDVLISSLQPAVKGMGIELLNYLKPDGGTGPRPNPQAWERGEWRISAVVDDLVDLHQRLQANSEIEHLGPLVRVPTGFGPGNLACKLRDPDGHGLLLFTASNS